MDQVSVGALIVSVLCTVVASSGFWAFVTRFGDKKSAQTQMLIGLGHDRIVFLGMQYVDRGYIYQDEYENLCEYLYKPYERMGGNGSAKHVMDEVNKLELRCGNRPSQKHTTQQ